LMVAVEAHVASHAATSAEGARWNDCTVVTTCRMGGRWGQKYGRGLWVGVVMGACWTARGSMAWDGRACCSGRLWRREQIP
jgi:hypothetical protein